VNDKAPFFRFNLPLPVMHSGHARLQQLVGSTEIENGIADNLPFWLIFAIKY